MATSSGEQQIIELKDMISQLNTTIKELNKTIADQKAELAWFRNKMFGISSEKNKVPVDTSGQLSLFDGFIDIEEMEKPLEEIQPEYVEVKNCVRRKRTSIKTLFKDIPVRQVEVDTLSDEDKLCLVCGTAMVPIGKEVIRTELVITPPQLERIEYLATTYECPKCKETEDPQFIKDNGKPALIRGSYASDSLVAYVAYQKYDMFSPLYRQEKFFEELHAPINRTTMASWIIKTAETYIQPVYDYFHRELLKRKFLMMDETPMQVLKEAGRKAENKSYFWLIRTGEDGLNPIVLYNYTETRAGENAKEFLKGIEPDYYLMADAYQGYNKLDESKRCCCYAHIRRMFLEAIPEGHSGDFTNPAVQGVLYCNKLFEYERSYKEKGLSYKQIMNRRLKDQKPVIDAFLVWAEKINTPHNDKMKRALKYLLNRRENLYTYIEDGRCSLSNNLSENAIRPVTIGRKNWLFSDTPAGAHANALYLTIVQMAKIYDLNVYEYIKQILEARPNKKTSDEELEKIAPWNDDVQEKCRKK